jgi:hypothetical protein
LQDGGEILQQGIANQMAPAIVYLLEHVDVGHDDRQLASLGLCTLHFSGKAFFQPQSVERTGQLVTDCLPRQPLMRILQLCRTQGHLLHQDIVMVDLKFMRPLQAA